MFLERQDLIGTFSLPSLSLKVPFYRCNIAVFIACNIGILPGTHLGMYRRGASLNRCSYAKKGMLFHFCCAFSSSEGMQCCSIERGGLCVSCANGE